MPGIVISDCPNPLPKSPPSAWAKIDCRIWYPVSVGSWYGLSQMSTRSWTWGTVEAKNQAPTRNIAIPITTNEKRPVAT